MYLIMTYGYPYPALVGKRLDGPSVYTIHGSQTVPEAQFRIVDGGKLHG